MGLKSILDHNPEVQLTYGSDFFREPDPHRCSYDLRNWSLTARLQAMVPVSDGNSDLVAHACRRMSLVRDKKNQFVTDVDQIKCLKQIK